MWICICYLSWQVYMINIVAWRAQTQYKLHALLAKYSIVLKSYPHGLAQIIYQTKLANYYFEDKNLNLLWLKTMINDY